jgi:hypothetical protein
MDAEKIFARAETWKKKAHCLSMDLRLRSLADARKFVKEHSIVLWDAKAELPNLLDAILGRIANGKEREVGKAAENCKLWRDQLLCEPEIVECRFFRKYSTAIHQDLWPFITVFARLNREKVEEGDLLSRDAKKILNYLKREGATPKNQVRKALKYTSTRDVRLFQKAKMELHSYLILAIRSESTRKEEGPILDLWENSMPRPVRTSADKITEVEAGAKLLSAALNSSILSCEKQLPKWFIWANGESGDWAESLIGNRTFLRIARRGDNWIIPRKILR